MPSVTMKRTWAWMESSQLFSGFSRHGLIEICRIQFQEHSSGASPIVVCGQTERPGTTKVEGSFCTYRMALTSGSELLARLILFHFKCQSGCSFFEVSLPCPTYWWGHCATTQKLAGSIPDGVVGIFHWRNPSGCTMALGLTQPLTEMSTKSISWG